MINKLVKEVNTALDNELYFVALNTALILPDICGKAEYPDKKSSERYKQWYQDNIGQYEQAPEDKENNTGFPYLSADVVYQLRCSVLHQGNPNVEKVKTGIDKFTLFIDNKNTFDIYEDSASLCGDTKTYRVSVRRLCLILTRAASKYYEKNKEKFNFFNYEIIYEKDIEKYLGRFDTFFKDKI